VLTELGNAGDDFANAFHVFLTYPFVDEVVGRDPQVARNLHMGDYTNLSIEMDIQLTRNNPTLPTDPPTILDPTVILDNVTKCLQSNDIESKACKKVIANAEALLKLREECAKPENEDKDVCREVNLIPGPPLSENTGGGPLDPITSALGRPGLSRPGHGPTADWSASRGPTMGQLMELYDPTLVHLLVPGMVTR
jgi:phospholipid/cholesterol/gamma-HCH transport system substrate-binding protein